MEVKDNYEHIYVTTEQDALKENMTWSLPITTLGTNVLMYQLYTGVAADDLDVTQFSSVPSYKRMCVCILKNDYYCTYMGFGKTKEAMEKRKKTLEKYKNL